MNLRFPSLTALILALSLAVTSVTMQVARVEAAGLAPMVICSGGDAVEVLVDSHGNPVDPGHPCPDCVLTWAAVTVGSVAAPERSAARSERLRPDWQGILPYGAAVGPRARGPPRLI